MVTSHQQGVLPCGLTAEQRVSRTQVRGSELVQAVLTSPRSTGTLSVSGQEFPSALALRWCFWAEVFSS